MSKTQNILDKLEQNYPAVKMHLDGLKGTYKNAREKQYRDSEETVSIHAEMKGSLIAMMLTGCITQFEFRILYTYYTL